MCEKLRCKLERSSSLTESRNLFCHAILNLWFM
jgi:hypothetical protein